MKENLTVFSNAQENISTGESVFRQRARAAQYSKSQK
jgi:hypothetical protein